MIVQMAATTSFHQPVLRDTFEDDDGDDGDDDDDDDDDDAFSWTPKRVIKCIVRCLGR